MSKKENKVINEEKRADFQQRSQLIISRHLLYAKHNTELLFILVPLVMRFLLELIRDSSEKDNPSTTIPLAFLLFLVVEQFALILNKLRVVDPVQQFQQDTEFRKLIFDPNFTMESAQKMEKELSVKATPDFIQKSPQTALMHHLVFSLPGLDLSYIESFLFMLGHGAGLLNGDRHARKSWYDVLFHRSQSNWERMGFFLRESLLTTSPHIEIRGSRFFGTTILFNRKMIKLLLPRGSVDIPRDLLITLVSDLIHHAFPWAFIESSDSAINVALMPYEMQADDKSWQTKFKQLFSHYRELQKVVNVHYRELISAVSGFTHQRWHCQYRSQWTDENKPVLTALLSVKTLALEVDEINSLLELLTSSGYTADHNVPEATIQVYLVNDTPKHYADNLKEAVLALRPPVEMKGDTNPAPPQEPAPLEISAPTYRLLPPLGLGIREELKNRNARYSSSLFTADTKHVETAIIYKFGEEHGECVLNDSCSKPLGAIRQLSQDDKPQNLFIKVTEKGEKALGKSGLDEKLVLAELDKACIVPHEYGQAHQKSGFVFSKEVTKGAGEPILIKLHFGFSPYSLYAVTWEAFEQENGTIAYLFLLDKCEDLHGRTNHLAKFPPKPTPVRAALT